MLLLVFGVAFAQNEDSALKMVKTLRLGENLGQLSYRTSKLTQTYRIVERQLGAQKADQLLRAELAVSVPRYQDQWDRNLAQAWGTLMTRDEMESVTAQRQQSPHAKKFLSLQNQAGEAMKEKSEPLLKAVVGDVLNRAFEASMPRQK